MSETDRELHVAKGFAVPRAIAARTVFVAGTKGSGKTHNAGVMVEEMLAAGVHVCVLDPLGVWWGLRHDDKGGPGGYPIVILGGEHGDRPLLPTAGENVADYVVRSGQSVILDMSGFAANAEQDRFVAALLAKLFRLKAADKSALHLVIDEADMFAPERPMSGTEIPLLGATKTIVTKGRSRGLSMTLITQRPQAIAKAAIEEADVVLCHRMQGVNAVKAMKAWTDLYASKEEAATFFDSLPRLADGECWVWSPQFLKTFVRVQFRPKRTFDSSRTPDPGETARRPKAAAAVDLDKLTSEMAATAEQAKANDPAELRRRVAELERELAAKPAAAAVAAEPKVERVEVPVLKDGQIAQLDKVVDRLQAVLATAGGQYLRALDLRDGLVAALRPALAPATQQPGPAPVAPTLPSKVNAPAPRQLAARPAAARLATAPSADGLSGPEQAILDTVLTLEARGLTPDRERVARWLAIHPNGGRYGSNLARLRSDGYLDGLTLTDKGRAAARGTATGKDAALAALPDAGKRRVVETLLSAGRPLSREELAGAMGIHPNGGRYGSDLAWLRTMGLITERGPIAPTAGLTW